MMGPVVQQAGPAGPRRPVMASLLKSRAVWITAVVGLVLLALWHLRTRPPLDSRTRAVLAGADKVEVFRIDGKDDQLIDSTPNAPQVKRLGGFPVIARGN